MLAYMHVYRHICTYASMYDCMNASMPTYMHMCFHMPVRICKYTDIYAYMVPPPLKLISAPKGLYPHIYHRIFSSSEKHDGAHMDCV